MPRNVLTIRSLGEDVCWLLVQQAMGIPDAKMNSDFLSNKVALLMFAKPSLPERLCVTGAFRQMGGTTIYQGDDGGIWRKEVGAFQKHLLPIFGYYLDCLYIYAIPIANLDTSITAFPVINAGSPDAHPCHALADIALMLKKSKGKKFIRSAWIGCDNGTLHSLIEGGAWFPFGMKIAMPPQIDSACIRRRLNELQTEAVLVDSPEEAVKDADYIYAGWHGGLTEEELENWRITPRLMRSAAPDARIMLSASPIRAIPIAPELLESKTSLLRRQAEYRLRIHKRMLHWVFEATS